MIFTKYYDTTRTLFCSTHVTHGNSLIELIIDWSFLLISEYNKFVIKKKMHQTIVSDIYKISLCMNPKTIKKIKIGPG